MLDVVNPATGQAIGQVPAATTPDLDEALDATQRGFAAWRDTAPADRGKILRAAAAMLRQRQEHVARIMTQEQGKPLYEARLEIDYAAALIDFHAGEGERIYGRVLPRPSGMRS
ncbi:MAG TPA: aldehyde dehydrogenase family protein, partial [Sphingomonadaceae bacterium]|nr:aldehyde dehydrogenase family protein [Sphingomonadaceae bacterium]